MTTSFAFFFSTSEVTWFSPHFTKYGLPALLLPEACAHTRRPEISGSVTHSRGPATLQQNPQRRRNPQALARTISARRCFLAFFSSGLYLSSSLNRLVAAGTKGREG